MRPKLDADSIERAASLLAATRANGGRLFILGVGGSAANASHAVNDFRKIANLEAYAPTDNVSELTARTNDEGWNGVFESWLKGSHLCARDCILVLSVGGGDVDKCVSVNLVSALQYANQVGAKVAAIVGRDGGFAARVADATVLIPTVNPIHVTPHSEAFQAVVWHLMVSHPSLKQSETKMGIGTLNPASRRAVFLDRDGVLIQAVVREGKPYPPGNASEISILPDVAESLRKLRSSGFLLCVVTNQPDVARGKQTLAVVEEMHMLLTKWLRLRWNLCLLSRRQGWLRVQKASAPGLVFAAASEHGIELGESYLVGDRWRDIEAGQRAGCRTAWIDRGYAKASPRLPADIRVDSLASATAWILKEKQKG